MHILGRRGLGVAATGRDGDDSQQPMPALRDIGYEVARRVTPERR